MVRAVELYNQMSTRAVEIHDEAGQDVLSPEVTSVQPVVAEGAPEDFLLWS
jgi:hypothetical protein